MSDQGVDDHRDLRVITRREASGVTHLRTVACHSNYDVTRKKYINNDNKLNDNKLNDNKLNDNNEYMTTKH